MADQVTWTSPDGAVIDLTDTEAGYTVLGEGTWGLRSVAYEVASQKYADVDGETVQAIRAAAGSVTLGLLVAADTPAAFRARTRALRRAMRPKAGMGTLTARTMEGERRSLYCYCTAGLEGDESSALDGAWWKLALKFYAPDPWWYGEPTSVGVGLGAPTAFFPTPPVTLSASSVQGTFTVDLGDADAPSYPTWTVTGPGSRLVLANATTGRSLQIDTTLTEGQSLTIDTRPGAQAIRRNDGANLMGALSADTDPALWPLIEGVNTVSAQLLDATSDSRITGTYRPRYAGI